MATYYTTSSSNQRDTPMIYSRENVPGSYPETQFLPGNAMIYMNPAVSYSDTLAGASSSVGEGMEATVSASQEQQILSSALGGSSQIQELQDFGSWRDQGGNRNGVLLLHPMAGATGLLQTGQGLSLSLGSQILPGIHQMNHHIIPFRSSQNLGLSRDEQSRDNEYAPHGISGGNQNSGITRTIPNSKYLKAAQQLLDEVVNVRKALKQFQPEGETNQENLGDPQMKNSKEGGGDVNSNPQESSTNPSGEISHAERQELQGKLTKLLSMLDEVDRRYKQYYHQMQIVVSSFDVIAGSGAAKPYTALALQTISRHFRCLRDAISGQILVNRKALGEHEGSDSKGVGITRLRYVDQQLRQQRALQQLGMMQQQAWRPQRGLPESSVSILRAWLFEHFLHPYPKDSDKIMLARQTGLSRSQVSNWFINARVRLWKPMVEEMYKEEFADAAEMDSNSSSENTPRTTKGDETRTSDDRAEEFPQCRSTQNQQTESKSDHILETGYGQGSSAANCSMFQDTMIHDDQMGGGRFMAGASPYHLTEMGRLGGGGGSGVSLTLGLQNFEGGGALPISGETHHSFLGMRGEDIYENATDGADFEYVNSGNRQHRLGSSQLLHDFVA